MKLRAIGTKEDIDALIDRLKPYVTHVSRAYDSREEGTFRYHMDVSFCEQVTEAHKQNCSKPRKPP